MTDSIRDILNRFDQANEGLDAAQKSVKQLPALFRPPNISPVLGSKKDPKNPMKGYFVGGESESKENTSEDVISAVKKKLGDYLQDVATAIKQDPDLIKDLPSTGEGDIGLAVKTIKTDDGREIKIHGNEDDGFRITVQNRPIKSTFKNIDEAVMACEMYCNHRRQAAASADYIEERA